MVNMPEHVHVSKLRYIWWRGNGLTGIRPEGLTQHNAEELVGYTTVILPHLAFMLSDLDFQGLQQHPLFLAPQLV
jgi:hypothetical protein